MYVNISCEFYIGNSLEKVILSLPVVFKESKMTGWSEGSQPEMYFVSNFHFTNVICNI